MQETMVGQNIIITERCRSLRQLGRNALRGKWKSGIIAVIIYMIVMQLPVLIFNELFGTNVANYLTDDGFTYNMDVEMYHQLYNSLPQTSALSGIWILLISGAMELGLMIYFLASFRGHHVVPRDIFLGFERFGKALGLFLFQSLFIFLWTCLFIIPGIIASIRYSQAFCVLADDPNKSIRECMNESKYMMRGNKMKYFLLQLSFIGWAILSSVPGSLLESITGTMTQSSALVIVTSMISALFLVPVYTYLYSTMAGFYEILAGHLIKETEPAPISPEQIQIDAPLAKIEEVIEQVEAEDAARQEALEEPYTADSSAAEDPDEAAASVLDADEISALSDSEVPELPEEGNTGGENTDND